MSFRKTVVISKNSSLGLHWGFDVEKVKFVRRWTRWVVLLHLQHYAMDKSNKTEVYEVAVSEKRPFHILNFGSGKVMWFETLCGF